MADIKQTDDIAESDGPNTSEEDLREESRLENAEAGENWEMTGKGVAPTPDTGTEPRMDADGAHEIAEDGLHSEMTAEGAELAPEVVKAKMTGSGAVPADRMPDEKRRTDR
jgi:hypothetical protein